MHYGAARRVGRWVAFLATLFLFVLASAGLTEARAHSAHAAPQTQAKVAVHASGFAAECVSERLDCQAAARAACCSMPGCSAPVASLSPSHWLPDLALREAAVPPIADMLPSGLGASPLIPPPRRPA